MPTTRSPVLTRHKKPPNAKMTTSNVAGKTEPENHHSASVPHRSTKTAQPSRSPGEHFDKALGVSCEESKEVQGETMVKGDKRVEKEFSASQKGRKVTRRLDVNAFKPWGGCSVSRSSSDTGSNSSENQNETFFCKGGPGKESCGDPVLDGEMGVRCDSCMAWFHATCQAIVEEAFEAIELWHPVLSWLCMECKAKLKRQNTLDVDQDRLGNVEAKVDHLDSFVRAHMRTVEQCLKEQEKTSAEQVKLLERSIKENHQEKDSYANIVKGSCAEVVSKVTSQITSLPSDHATKTTPRAVQDLSAIFDDYQEKEKRKLNVVVCNMKESENDSFEERTKLDALNFEKMVREAFSLKVACVRSFRAGKKFPGKDRLLIVTLESVGIKRELLRLAPQLRSSEAYNSIYINPDLTPREREQGRKLREELTARREKGEKNLSIRKGRIVCLNVSHCSGTNSVHPPSSDAECSAREPGSLSDKNKKANAGETHPGKQ